MSFFKKLFGLDKGASQKSAPAAAPAPVAKPAPAQVEPEVEQATQAIVDALGGAANIQSVEACAATRLRISLNDSNGLDEAAVRAAGANGLMQLADNRVHVLVGLKVDQFALAVERLRA